MRELNLLDWRREVREQRNKSFYFSLGSVVVVALAVVGGVHFFLAGKISAQEARNSRLSAEIASLDLQIREIRTLKEEKDRLLARMGKIQQLQSGRADIVHFMHDLATTLPPGVFYTSIAQNGNRVTLEGRAQSNARVSSLMRELDGSDWLGQPRLEEIRADRSESSASPRLVSFRLVVETTRPASEAVEE